MARTETEIRVTSPAFEPGESIPRQYTDDGQDESPPLKWDHAPAGTKHFAIVCEDPDATKGLFTHWLAFNLPAESRGLGKGFPKEPTLPDGTVQGTNGFGRIGYSGPAPPRGKPHRYTFRVYALDGPLELPPGAHRDDLATAMFDHVLAEGQLQGVYARTVG